MSRLYTEAASVLGPSLNRKKGSSSSLKSRTYSDGITNKKMTHLLVSETLKHKASIDLILIEARIDLHSISHNLPLAYIYLYEMLFGRSKRILGGGALKKQVESLQPQLTVAKSKVAISHPHLFLKSNNQAGSVPRYCRVNLLKTSVHLMCQQFPLAKIDEHIPYLLVFPPNTDLHDSEFVLNGSLILQDKSSCFPVYAIELTGLNVNEDGIDACAAPGNKTTQFSVSRNHVFAFDKSIPRHALLEKRVEQAGASLKVSCHLKDFLQQRHEDFPTVRTILLDPSCSGSGSFQVERTQERQLKGEDERVSRLASFQLEILLHALSFPLVSLVSYSTCSILEVENESVVHKALLQMGEEWELVHALPAWPRRGIPGELSEELAHKVVRADYRLGDKTGGFFLALFVRKNNTLVKINDSQTTPQKKGKKRVHVVRNLITKKVLRRIVLT